jgi:pimeloyl-ACP methyl ester carboxylesterase
MSIFRQSLTALAICGIVNFAAAGHAAAQKKAQPAAVPRHVQVDLFRGLADIFSRGMDTLTDKLNRQGYSARVYSHTHWQSVARNIADRYARGDRDIVVLIGHSLGADATLQIANTLARSNVPVDLIVTFDGTHPHQVPGNVRHLVNFFQNNGFGKKISPGPGFSGELDNVDLTADNSLSHVTIDKSHRLHAEVIAKITDIVNQDVAAARKAKKPKAKKPQAVPPKAGSAQTGSP